MLNATGQEVSEATPRSCPLGARPSMGQRHAAVPLSFWVGSVPMRRWQGGGHGKAEQTEAIPHPGNTTEQLLTHLGQPFVPS